MPLLTLGLQVFYITPTYGFVGCYSGPGPLAGTLVQVVPAPAACFDMCDHYSRQNILLIDVGSRWQCYCSNNFHPTAPVDCRRGQYMLYWKGYVTPSALVRRNERANRSLASRRHELCPEDMKACAIRPGSTEYECLDTSSELGKWGAERATHGHRHGLRN